MCSDCSPEAVVEAGERRGEGSLAGLDSLVDEVSADLEERSAGDSCTGWSWWWWWCPLHPWWPSDLTMVAAELRLRSRMA